MTINHFQETPCILLMVMPLMSHPPNTACKTMPIPWYHNVFLPYHGATMLSIHIMVPQSYPPIPWYHNAILPYHCTTMISTYIMVAQCYPPMLYCHNVILPYHGTTMLSSHTMVPQCYLPISW